MDSNMSIKEVKEYLTNVLKKLETMDENTAFNVHMASNGGSQYLCNLDINVVEDNSNKDTYKNKSTWNGEFDLEEISIYFVKQ